MAVNQQQIADRLNLSRATVSRSLSNLPGIDPETRSKVLLTATQMGYRYSANRRRKQGRSANCTVGVLVCNRGGEFGHGAYTDVGTGLLAGVSESLGDVNASLDVSFVDPAEAHRLLDPEHQPVGLREGNWAGALLIYPFPRDVVGELSKQLRCVSLINQYEGLGIDCVDSDQGQSVIRLVSRLYELGHRKIGFLAHPPNVGEPSMGQGEVPNWVNTRHAAYFQALTRMGLPYESSHVLNVGRCDLDFAELAGRVAALLNEGVTGWACASDHEAYELMTHLRSLGIRVPDDVSITGFDGIHPPVGQPQLTTAAAPLREIGMAGLRRLMGRIRQPAGLTRHILLDCQFIEGSTINRPSSTRSPIDHT